MKLFLIFTFLLISEVFSEDKKIENNKNRYEKIHKQFPKIAQIIIQESIKQGIKPSLTAAIIFVESRGREKHIGASGEIGLMQVMPYHFKNLPKKEDYFDPAVNIKIGLRYLKYCIGQKETLEQSISCYNTGPNTKKLNRDYLKKVLKKYNLLKEILTKPQSQKNTSSK